MNLTTYASLIESHYARTLGSPIERIRRSKGPVHDLPREFYVLLIPRLTDIITYATCCMSLQNDKERLELHILAKQGDIGQPDDIVELLTAIAHYHRTGESLGLGHTINFGRPWLRGSACTHGVISLPYLDGPSLEWLDVPPIRFLWLIPITEAELHFKKQHGLEALERLFEQTQFDFLDELRSSVV